MKGIILAGGAGTRLYPASLPVSKILLPVYDKPMIYYPLSTLISAGIKDILVISSPDDSGTFEKLLGDGSRLGIRITHKIQYVQKGIADAFLIGKDFTGNDDVALILGDNIFYGENFENLLTSTVKNHSGATIFAYETDEPERFGIVEFDENNNVVSIEEKPKHPKSNYAVTGLYFYDNKVVDYAEKLKPSARGELEITDLNKMYLDDGNLKVAILDKSYRWLDTGTHESLLEASLFVKEIQEKTGTKVACPEFIAMKKGFISSEIIAEQIEHLWQKNDYYGFIKNTITQKLSTH